MERSAIRGRWGAHRHRSPESALRALVRATRAERSLRSPDGAQRNPGAVGRASTSFPGVGPSGARPGYAVAERGLRSPDGAQRNPGGGDARVDIDSRSRPFGHSSGLRGGGAVFVARMERRAIRGRWGTNPHRSPESALRALVRATRWWSTTFVARMERSAIRGAARKGLRSLTPPRCVRWTDVRSPLRSWRAVRGSRQGRAPG